jgi:hypothetical protein
MPLPSQESVAKRVFGAVMLLRFDLKTDVAPSCNVPLRPTYMVCRGNLPNYLIARLNRRTTSSQRVVGYRRLISFSLRANRVNVN